MTELAKVDAHAARSVAGRIRQGVRDYLATLALVKRAWDEEHWRVLGYDSWQDYVDGEFGADRLGLPMEHRDKALNDLRMSGMSVRQIAATTGVPKSTIAREVSQLGHLTETVTGADGKTYAATRPQTPAPMPEPGPEASTSTGSGHNHPLATGEADAPLAADAATNSSVSEAPAGAPAGAQPAGAGDSFAEVLDRLVPDDNPHREWQGNFLRAISGVNRLMLFTPAAVAEKADQQCLEELARLADHFADWRARITQEVAAGTPDNVTPIRRIS